MSPAERAREYRDLFIGECTRQKAPLYVRLARGVRDDAELVALSAQARPGQPVANLLLGAVHYLLLKGAPHALRAHYCTLNPDEEFPPGEDPFPLFRDFTMAHQGEIASLVRSRVTNANEVGRAAYLRAGFAIIAAEAGQPLHIIELGPSAGLNLHWDSYHYRYLKGRRHSAWVRRWRV